MRAKGRVALALALVGVLVAGGLAFVVVTALSPGTPPLTPAQQAALRAERLLGRERSLAREALKLVSPAPPTQSGAPEPAIGTTLFRRPLARHQVVGFVPYWELANLSSADYTGATTLCFYGLSLSGDGALLESGPEWGNAEATLASGAFGSFVASAHGAGDRVLLTVASADDTVIAKLLSSPRAAVARLAPALEAIVRANGLDGVNIDLEGTRPSERERFVSFVGDLVTALRRLDPAGELMLDSYAGSAGSPPSFFDVARLSRLVDAVFIEGYDMTRAGRASSSSPLATNDLSYSEAQTLIQYSALVPKNKLILGLPFYGNDFTTASLVPGATLVRAAAETVTYGAVHAAGRSAYWDPVAASPYTRFRLAGVAHETYYDDPLSVAVKTALASEFHLLGVGAWAFGMEQGDAAMIDALDGGTAPLKHLPAR